MQKQYFHFFVRDPNWQKRNHIQTDPSQMDSFFPFTRCHSPRLPDYKSPDREDEKYQLFYKSTE
jgi:hypothetical protein